MIKNEKIDIEKLGDEKLDLKIAYQEAKKEKNLPMLGGTIKDFLKAICGETYNVSYDKQIHSVEMEALNKDEDKIKKIVDYVVNLDEKTLSYTQVNTNDLLIYRFDEIYLDDMVTERKKVSTLDFKKTYIILQLIEWGINPLEIRRCLKSNLNDNFNWKKFMEYVMDNKDILWSLNKGSINCKVFYKAMNMIRVMYLLNPLFESNENQYDNLKPFEIDFLLKDLSFLFEDGGMHFIIWYLNELDNNDENKKVKEYLLKIPDGYVLNNFVSKSQISEKEDIDKLQQGNLLDLSGRILKNNPYFFDFCKKDFEEGKDFWTLITNLNNAPVLISFFTLVAMRKVSFTEGQMKFISQKINNDQVMTTLRQINQSLGYKFKCSNQYNLTRRVKFGPVTAFLDYIFLKMSRGTGYLGAALFNAILCMLPIGIGGGAMFDIVYLASTILSFTLWTTTFWIVASILSGVVALLFLLCFIDMYCDDLKSRFIKFADGMQKSYENGKVVYWLESYNIKHLTNNIGEPPIGISINFPNNPTSSYQDLPELRESNTNNSNMIPESIAQTSSSVFVDPNDTQSNIIRRFFK